MNCHINIDFHYILNETNPRFVAIYNRFGVI